MERFGRDARQRIDPGGAFIVTASGAARSAAAAMPADRSQDLAAVAVQCLLEGTGDRRFSPLVVVSSSDAGASRCLAACGVDAAACRPWCGTWDGPALGREIAAAAAAEQFDRLVRRLEGYRLVVVDGVDRLGGADRERTFVQLFDAATAAGTAFCLSLAAHPAQVPVDPALATRLAGGLVVTAPRPTHGAAAATGAAPPVRLVLQAVARHYGLTLAELIGPSRRRSLADARGVGMYLARRMTALSLGSIGSACGGRDHTTVLHAVRLVAARLRSDPGLAADVDRLADAIAAETRSHPRTARRRRPVASASGSRARRTGQS